MLIQTATFWGHGTLCMYDKEPDNIFVNKALVILAVWSGWVMEWCLRSATSQALRPCAVDHFCQTASKRSVNPSAHLSTPQTPTPVCKRCARHNEQLQCTGADHSHKHLHKNSTFLKQTLLSLMGHVTVEKHHEQDDDDDGDQYDL